MARGDHKVLVVVAARAFWSDPLSDFFARDMLHEYRVLPMAFNGFLRDLMRPAGRVWVAQDGDLVRGISRGGYLRAPIRGPRSPKRNARCGPVHRLRAPATA